MTRKKAPKDAIEYRVRGIGTSCTSLQIYGPFKELAKAERSLTRCNDDYEAIAHVNTYYANRGPYILEARYVGPWEPLEDAETRREVIADNTEWVPEPDPQGQLV